MQDAIENIQEMAVTIALRVLYRSEEDDFIISACRPPSKALSLLARVPLSPCRS